MKPALLSCFFLLCLISSQAQLLQVKLGMSEQDLLLIVQSRTREISPDKDFNLLSRTSDSYVYRHTGEEYQLDISFTLKGGEVVLIKSTHTSLSPRYTFTMREYYEETVKAWHTKEYFMPNPQLAAQAIHSFERYQAEAAAFTDPDMTLMFVFMHYTKGDQAVFTRMERKF